MTVNDRLLRQLDLQRNDFKQQLKEHRERHERLMDGQHEQMMELRKQLASLTSSACP